MAEAPTTGNIGVMMVGDGGFITLASGRQLVTQGEFEAQGEFENIVAQRNLNLRPAPISA